MLLSGLTPQERANWQALVAVSPRQIARRLGMGTKDASALQSFGKLVLMVDLRVKQRQPYDDLETKALAAFDAMSLRVKRELWKDEEIKRITQGERALVVP